MKNQEFQVVRGKTSLTLRHEGSGKIPYADLVGDLWMLLIRELLAQLGGIKGRVADKLTLNRTTLVEKCRKYGFPLEKGTPRPLRAKPQHSGNE